MSRAVIALLTDFGTRDHYAGTMKGVALGICPDVTFVDITHDIPAHDVLAGALELAASYKFFPPGTIFLVVVDPGVGSSRRGIAADAGDHKFVAPDNGVLTAVLDVRVGTHAVSKIVSTYADAAAGEVCALFGSTEHLEIAANGSNAAAALHVERGAPVHVARRA